MHKNKNTEQEIVNHLQHPDFYARKYILDINYLIDWRINLRLGDHQYYYSFTKGIVCKLHLTFEWIHLNS